MHCPACHKDNPPGATVCEFCRTPLPDPSSRFQPTVPVSGISVGDQSFAVGGLIASRYLVERELGRGGMGVVYLVKDQKLHGKEVALKLISADLTDSHQGQERFVQEVLAAQELQHANIVRVFHLDEVAGQSFFTMEYVPGRSLREVVEERKRQGQTFSLKECAAVLMPVLKALHHAHTQTSPVIHRDIKPDNIIVTGDFPSPQVKVLDFGLAKMLSPSKLTTTAMTMGTAYYMAPEQVQGAKDIDQRADLFSVGVVFYEMLTGQVPSGRFKLPAEMNPELPAKIDDLMDKVLQQHPKDRHSSARELAGALESVVQNADENAQRKEHEAAEIELRKQREAEAVKRQAEAEARRVAQEEARRKAEEDARHKVEEEARLKSRETTRRQVEWERRQKDIEEIWGRHLEEENREEEVLALLKAEMEPRRRKMIFVTVGAVLILLAFVLFLNGRNSSDKPLVTPQAPSVLASSGEPSVSASQGAKQISLESVRQYFVPNQDEGQLFIIEGRAVNRFREARELIRIKASLFDEKGGVIVSQEVMCGNVVSLYQLQVSSKADIESALSDKAGILTNNTNIQPGEGVHFMVVFFKTPEEVKEFGLDVIQSSVPQQ